MNDLSAFLLGACIVAFLFVILFRYLEYGYFFSPRIASVRIVKREKSTRTYYEVEVWTGRGRGGWEHLISYAWLTDATEFVRLYEQSQKGPDVIYRGK